MRLCILFFLTVLVTSLSAQSTEVSDWVGEGIALHDQGDFEGAIQKYKEALKIDPASALVHYEMALTYQAAKDFRQALFHAEKAMQYGDERLKLQAAIIKGSAMDDQGRTKESVEFYKKILKEYPNDYLLLYNYAVSCGRMGLNSEAEMALEKALQNNFSHPGSHLKLAYMKLDRGEKVRAAVGLYFFLMLENNTPRATDALNNLRNLIQPEPKATRDSIDKSNAGPKNIDLTIFLQSDEDASMNAAEIGLAAVSLVTDEKHKDKNPEEKFIENTRSFFTLMGELKENRSKEKKKSKKKKEEAKETIDLVWDWYVPFFYDLSKSDHLEAFGYHILSASRREDITAWVNEHAEKMEYFYLWVKNH